MDDQERHYSQETLNKIFAAASAILLLALFSLFANDYLRPWKKHQRDFRDLEVEKTRVKYDLTFNSVKQKEEYETLLKQIEEGLALQKSQSAELKQLQKDLSRRQADHDIVNQQLQFARAKYDSVKYHYEELSHQKNPQAQKKKEEMDGLQKKMDELRLQLEERKAAIQSKQDEINRLTEKSKTAQKDFGALTKQVEILEKKLKSIDPQEMSLANNLASAIRNLPIVDLANPSYRVKQIVLHDLKDSVNFLRVPKVDRCMTCHLGIDNPDYENAPQPYTTHPNLALFVGNNSKHPLEEFGCTTCHGGRGRGTDFNSAAHSPSSDQQREEWEKKYNWHEDHHWETPMLPSPYIESTCFKCHSGQTTVPSAPKLNLGLNLIERAGCYACHTIEKFKDWPKPGPDLTKLASKTSKEWAYLWIANPKSFRHNTWMPSFFGQSNNNDPESAKRSYQEIHAMVHYLFAQSGAFLADPLPFKGDPKKGEELVSSLGCFGCHSIAPEKAEHARDLQGMRREHGPNLIGLGTKTNEPWLYNWLKDPDRYHPGTKMPNLRLSDQEASDIASFLSVDETKDWLKNPIPIIDENMLGTIVEDFLLKSTSVEEAKKELANMSANDKLFFAGEKLIRQYGCFSCHNIKGFENDKPIGTDLTEQGSKSIHNLDFGFVDIPQTKEAFYHQKLKDPRIYDMGKVKDHLDKLKMPNYHFSDEEIEAIVTVLMGFTNEQIPDSKKFHNPDVEKGQKIVRQMNCQGCHIIEGEGGAIQPTLVDWLVKYRDRSENEAKAMISSFSPPNLIGEGKKIHSQWLFEFIHSPQPIRPWLATRMPTYHFTTEELNEIVKYFNALDQSEFPFAGIKSEATSQESIEAGAKLFSNDYFGCAQCHIVGDQMPAGSPDSWAPNFVLAKHRLRPEWIIEWLKNPAVLLPGTKMPTYFDPQNFEASGPEDILNGDELQQIKALRDYILTLSSGNAPAKAVQPVVPEAKIVPKEEKKTGVKDSAPTSPAAAVPVKAENAQEPPADASTNQPDAVDSSVSPQN